MAGNEGQTFEYRLQRLPLGVVMLDSRRRVRAASGAVRGLLGGADGELVGVDILDLHPPQARAKVGWLIASAGEDPAGSAMIVATRMGNLLARAIALACGPAPEEPATCLMFFMLGDLAAGAAPEPEEAGPFLLKLPIQKGMGGVTGLIDIDKIAALSAQGHYCEALTLDFIAFCPRSLADLGERLDPALFVRVHRRHIVNLSHVRAAERVDGAWFLRMAAAGEPRLPVGRRQVERLRKLLAF
jgi:LytTR family transcriptional regulator, CO-responsive transcriptional regulator RcoM